MKVYRGVRDIDRCASVLVQRDGRRATPLRMRRDLDNHSPTGLEWGYPGSGPAQLALALLADALSDDETAVHLHQRFKWAVVAKLPQERGWQMTEDEVRAHAARLMAEEQSA
jgi:hypothetical protein